MNQRESESIGMPRAAARRTVRRPQLGVERLESRAMLTSYYVPDWDGAWPESLPVEADERELTAPVEDFAGDEPIWILPAPDDYPVEADDPEAATPDEDLSDEPVTEPVPQPPSEDDGSTPVPAGDKVYNPCDIFFWPTVGTIFFEYGGAPLRDGSILWRVRGIHEGEDVEAVLADELGSLRPGILGNVVTKVFVSIPDGKGGRLEYELDYSKSGEPESTVGDTPAEAPPVTEPDPIEPFATDTPGTASETDWTESDWSETEADWVEPETSLVESDHVAHEFVPELPAHDLTESFRQELLRNSLVFAPMSVVVRPTVVRFDALSMRSPAAAYFAALAGLPSQVSEAASVTAVGAKRRGR